MTLPKKSAAVVFVVVAALALTVFAQSATTYETTPVNKTLRGSAHASILQSLPTVADTQLPHLSNDTPSAPDAVETQSVHGRSIRLPRNELGELPSRVEIRYEFPDGSIHFSHLRAKHVVLPLLRERIVDGRTEIVPPPTEVRLEQVHAHTVDAQLKYGTLREDDLTGDRWIAVAGRWGVDTKPSINGPRIISFHPNKIYKASGRALGLDQTGYYHVNDSQVKFYTDETQLTHGINGKLVRTGEWRGVLSSDGSRLYLLWNHPFGAVVYKRFQ